METDNVAKLSRIVSSISSHLEVPMVSEVTLRLCLSSAAAFKANNLNPMLEALLAALSTRKVRAPTFQDAFWERLIEIIASIKDLLPYQAARLKTFTMTPKVSFLNEHWDSAELIALLRTTELKCPVPFWFAAPELYRRSAKKIGEGGFADIYLIQKADESERVLKIQPVGGTNPEETDESDGEDDDNFQLSFGESRVDVSAWMELAKLKDGILNRCSTFLPAYKINVVQDVFPPHAVSAWRKYAKHNSTDLIKPDKYAKDQFFLIIETDMAGEDIDNFQMKNATEALAIFLQVVFAIAVAEEEFQFEHRDLHCANILVRKCPELKFTFIVRGVVHEVPSFGVRATIIDFTYSRLITDERILYLDLEDFIDPKEHCKKKFYSQYYVYSKMLEVTGGDWAGYFPYTNVLWFYHILTVLLTDRRVSRKTLQRRPVDKRSLFLLKMLKRTCLKCSDACDMVRQFLSFPPNGQVHHVG